jgi:hypothetical protein
MELIIGDDDMIPYMGTIMNVKEKYATYLNNKLYTDPEFFGDFGPENIVEIKEWE